MQTFLKLHSALSLSEYEVAPKRKRITSKIDWQSSREEEILVFLGVMQHFKSKRMDGLYYEHSITGRRRNLIRLLWFELAFLKELFVTISEL